MTFLKRFGYEIVVFFIYLISRLPSLGHDTFNTDVWKWKSRIFNFGSGVFNLNFEQTIQKYHPGVSLMWIGSIAVKVNSFYHKVILGVLPLDNDIQTVFQLHFVQKLLITLVIGITLSSIFFVLKRLFSAKYAFIFVVLLMLEPFYIALTRVVHLEGLMSTFMLASFVWFYHFLVVLEEGFFNKKSFLISSFFAASAILTKTSALFLLPFIALILLLHKMKNRSIQSFQNALKETFKPYILWLLLVLLFFVLLWPAMWVVPLEALQTLYRGIFTIGVEGGHGQIYFSRFVTDPGITFYPVVFLLKSSVYLLLGLIGYLFYKKDMVSRRKKQFVFFALLFSLLYVLLISVPSKKLDRYILPSFLGLTLISSFFYEYLLSNFSKVSLFSRFNINSTKRLYLIFATPILLYSFWLHPDYFSYYNPLFGGLHVGIKVIEPKWIIGHHQVVSYFTSLKETQNYEDFGPNESIDALINTSALDNKLTIGFQEKYYTQVHPFIRDIGAWATIKDLTPHAKETKYFVYPVWDDDSAQEDRFKIEYIDSIKLRGVAVYNVYKRIK